MSEKAKNFGLIGVAGYIAVRHLEAIKQTGNKLLASLDPFDSVGLIDQYFPDSDFFVEFERYDRHFEKLKRSGVKIDFVSICSPNFLHDSHIRFALRHQADALCEKPIVLNPWNIDALKQIEQETGKRVYTVLQLRLHPTITALKEKVMQGSNKHKHDIDLTYITSRGNWYKFSWKGDIQKSGGVATNIGIHFFDMLSWVYGETKNNFVHMLEEDKAAGYLEMENARVRWFLSIDHNDLPEAIKEKGQRTYRSIRVEGKEIEFSGGFTNLHTETYRQILGGGGYGLDDARSSVQTVYDIRNSKIEKEKGEMHPFAYKLTR
ncbi:MAG: Gfo/Idh/MocA family oxidoreductase [Bacteroidales bacterium]|nr:Gfo/Idh/MocA family oxidoreductase [Bacteroidales bacterium]